MNAQKNIYRKNARTTGIWLMLLALLMTSAPLQMTLAHAPRSKGTTTLLSIASAMNKSKPRMGRPRKPTGAELTAPITRTPSFSESPSDAEIVNAHLFSEPLVPIEGKVLEHENIELVQAVLAFKQ
jgi:hypothetical protein